jgi:hypothetical protein
MRVALKSRQAGKIAKLTCAGAATAAIARWVVTPEWMPATVVVLLFLLGSILIFAMQRHTRSIMSLIRSRVNNIDLIEANIADGIRRMEESVRLNEIRVRQVGQIVKTIELDVKLSQKQLEELLKQGTENEARVRHVGQLVKTMGLDVKLSQKQLEELLKQGTENEARVRHIGQLVKGQDSKASTYVPLALRNPSGGFNSIGRLAAAVKSDTSRSRRILEAVDSSSTFSGGQRTVGIVGTPSLQNFLRPNIETCFYLPSLCVAQDAQFRPTTLLIEERAFLGGVWSGALSSSGLALYDELCQIVDAVVSRDGSVYFLRNAGSADINTQDLKDRSIVIDSQSDFTAEWSEGLQLRFLDELKSYCVTEN